MKKETAKENALVRRISPNMESCGIIDKYPENVRQLVDLVSAILRRMKERQLDNPNISCLHIATRKGVAAT